MFTNPPYNPLGSGRRSSRIHYQPLATNYLREYGLWRGLAYRENISRLGDQDNEDPECVLPLLVIHA